MTVSVGVLGGMGPLATADFLRKLTEATPSRRDQDHIPLILYGIPTIPDRSSGILGTGPSPEGALCAGISFLVSFGVDAIVIPCNTAHYWYDAMARRASRVPILHIVDAVRDALSDQGIHGGRVGLMATAGTIKANLYQSRLGSAFDVTTPTDDDLNDLIMPGIRAVKAGRLEWAETLMEQAAQRLIDRGATKLVLGCTEIPLALPTVDPVKANRYVDSTGALARACVRWWEQNNLDWDDTTDAILAA